MTVTVNHAKTNAISDWTQAQLDEQIALGNFPSGTTLADIVLPSDWNDDHTLTGLGTMAEQDANNVAITGGTATLSSVTTPSVTATTNNLTLSAISTGNVNLNTLGGTQFKAIEATGSVNVWNVRGGDGSTTSPRFTTEGTGTNIAGQFNTKGTGALQFFSGNTEQMRVTNTTSAVNYVQVTGSATTTTPVISAQGSDSNIGLRFAAKGAGGSGHRFFGNSAATEEILRMTSSNAAVNYHNFTSSASTFAPTYSVAGTDTNISMAFQPKGTGAIDLAAGSSGVNISNGGTVTAITRTGNGTGYTSFPTVNITAPTTAGGVQAVATVANMQSIGASISAGGTGYTVGNVITITGGTPVTVAATFTVSAVSGGVVTAVTALNFAPYTVLPTAPVSTTGGSGTGLTLTALTWAIGSSFTISNAGSGYIEQPTITFSGGGGSGAAAYATVGSATIFRSLAGSGNSAQSLSFHSSSGESLRVTTSTTGGTSANFLQVAGGASGNGPRLTAEGSDTNIFMGLVTKGTGAFQFLTNSSSEQFRVSHTASAVNYVQVTGAATTANPAISTQGSDTNISMSYIAKGTGQHIFATNGTINTQQFRILHTAGTIANYGTVTGNVAGSAPVFSVAGTDTNIDLALTPKGTGLVRFGTYVAGALLATGYINIKAADGTTYKVLVST